MSATVVDPFFSAGPGLDNTFQRGAMMSDVGPYDIYHQALLLEPRTGTLDVESIVSKALTLPFSKRGDTDLVYLNDGLGERRDGYEINPTRNAIRVTPDYLWGVGSTFSIFLLFCWVRRGYELNYSSAARYLEGEPASLADEEHLYDLYWYELYDATWREMFESALSREEDQKYTARESCLFRGSPLTRDAMTDEEIKSIVRRMTADWMAG